ncbi:MAG: hypothetical protein GEU83_03715 [Pseudonocardiaceae bacterium]|nr:hypothetical protein [Pseudonocardiaceae bacterium]
MRIPRIPRKNELDPPEDPAIDVLPASNGEYVPKPPSRRQRAIMALQDQKIEEQRHKFGLSRRDFVRTAAAMGIGVWAVDQVTGGLWGRYSWADGTATTDACDLENPGSQLANLPGEFILDTQGHHLDDEGRWRVENPGFNEFLMTWTSQAMGEHPGANPPRGFGAGEVDPIANLNRFHYFKEMFLDSSTTVSLLTALPNLPDATNITPIAHAKETMDLANSLSGSQRCFIHAFAQPNRGFMGRDRKPLYQDEDFAWMEETARTIGPSGWKLYCGWGDGGPSSKHSSGAMPAMNGWWFDDDNGIAITEHIRNLSQKYGLPPVICTHKGLAFNGVFDSAKFSPRDMGVIGRLYPDVTFYTYHSGYDGERQLPYPGDDKVNSSNRGVDAFIKSLRENGMDATRFVPAGLTHGNSPNMYAELGTAWWNVMHDADQAAHMLGKLLTYVGPRRIVLGTDCIWYGAPQPQFVMLRALQFSPRAKQLYNLPYGLDGDRWDPQCNALSGASYTSPHPNVPDWPTDGSVHPERTIRNGIFGRNAAAAYGLDPDVVRNKISCDDVNKLRDSYVQNPGTTMERTPHKTNKILGPRTRREFFNYVNSPDYSP